MANAPGPRRAVLTQHPRIIPGLTGGPMQSFSFAPPLKTVIGACPEDLRTPRPQNSLRRAHHAWVLGTCPDDPDIWDERSVTSTRP
jgi:hypothetical protein